MPLFTLLGCNGNNEISTKCPLGAPSLVFYDQGNNTNFVTIGGAAQIVAEFQQDKYDALVVDATSGLRQIKKYPNTPFRLAKLLTAGNLYLISFNYAAEPTSSNTLVSFGNSTSIPYYVTNKLNSTWNIPNIQYETDVSAVLRDALLNSYDYYVIAEPALSNLDKTKLKLNKKLELNGVTIPQAALFINKNSYNKNKDKFTKYLNDLKIRIDNCINHPEIFKDSLDKYGDDSKVSQRFGFKSSVAYSVQQSGNNGFAFTTEPFTFTDMNNFMNKVDHSEIQYDGSEFINV